MWGNGRLGPSQVQARLSSLTQPPWAPLHSSRIWLLLFNQVWAGRQPGDHFLVPQGSAIPSQQVLREHSHGQNSTAGLCGLPGWGGAEGWRGGLRAEVWRGSGEERTSTPVLSPEGEPGPTHMAEPLWAHHFTSVSLKLPFVKQR